MYTVAKNIPAALAVAATVFFGIFYYASQPPSSSLPDTTSPFGTEVAIYPSSPAWLTATAPAAITFLLVLALATFFASSKKKK